MGWFCVPDCPGLEACLWPPIVKIWSIQMGWLCLPGAGLWSAECVTRRRSTGGPSGQILTPRSSALALCNGDLRRAGRVRRHNRQQPSGSRQCPAAFCSTCTLSKLFGFVCWGPRRKFNLKRLSLEFRRKRRRKRKEKRDTLNK